CIESPSARLLALIAPLATVDAAGPPVQNVGAQRVGIEAGCAGGARITVGDEITVGAGGCATRVTVLRAGDREARRALTLIADASGIVFVSALIVAIGAVRLRVTKTPAVVGQIGAGDTGPVVVACRIILIRFTLCADGTSDNRGQM